MWRKRLELAEQKERIIKDVARSRERTMNRAVKLLADMPRAASAMRFRNTVRA